MVGKLILPWLYEDIASLLAQLHSTDWIGECCSCYPPCPPIGGSLRGSKWVKLGGLGGKIRGLGLPWRLWELPPELTLTGDHPPRPYSGANPTKIAN